MAMYLVPNTFIKDHILIVKESKIFYDSPFIIGLLHHLIFNPFNHLNLYFTVGIQLGYPLFKELFLFPKQFDFGLHNDQVDVHLNSK